MNVNGKQSLHMNGKLPVIVLLAIIFLVSFLRIASGQPVRAEDYIWKVRSVDTMKTSRDLALVKLNDATYDTQIAKQISLIKNLGANYVSIDTPYDDQFLPYLTRWVNEARRQGLNVWFRGSFSGYEGWFGYPKSLSPDDLLNKTSDFIAKHPDLFKDNDIFDPCPECENGGFWPQNAKNNDYNQFLKKKNDVLKSAFAKINKKVIYNWNSIIGGRAKDVVTKDTASYLGNLLALDHYTNSVQNYNDYINYFASSLGSKVVFSEFGAPIPTIHGSMTQVKQANFINSVMQVMYKNKSNVLGVNYWVLSAGTTALYNLDYSPREVVGVIQNYFKPAIIKGTIKNTFKTPIKGVKISTNDGLNTVYSDSNGNYQLVVPANSSVTLNFESNNYITQTQSEDSLIQNQIITNNIVLKPSQNNILYFFQNFLSHLNL